MRYKIEVYKPQHYEEVIDLLKRNGWGKDLPSKEYLLDLGLICRDIKRNTVVGFIYAIVEKSDHAYSSYFMTDESVRKNKLKGNRVALLLHEGLANCLKLLGKKAYVGWIKNEDTNVIKIYKKRGVIDLGINHYFKRILT